ncbi:MAG TPA: hypothetical protein VFD90_07685 [Gaiellales bacterium]|jgi:uncharacterized membrane protein|nr:hypothetical protein [Gaiellales bacterium]
MLHGLTPGKALALSLLAFIVVVIVVVLLWHTLGAWLGVIILAAAVLAITYPIVWALRSS